MSIKVKAITENLGSVRKEIIAELKAIAKKHGTGAEKHVEFADYDLSFVQSNTEDYIWSFNSKGNLNSDNSDDKNFKQLSTDLLLLILTELTEAVK